MKTLNFLLFLFLFSFTYSYGQGVIFKKEQAMKLFGPAKQSFTVSGEELLEWSNDNSKVGFRIVVNQLFVSGETRARNYKGSVMPDYELMYYFNSDSIKTLIKLDSSLEYKVELRTAYRYDILNGWELNEIITISGINWVLELGQGCPPDCLLFFINDKFKIEFVLTRKEVLIG